MARRAARARPGTTVVDLGAGTGKLTRAARADRRARDRGRAARRRCARSSRRRCPASEVLAGSAEELPLADGSADAVVAASAFHWFDTERALAGDPPRARPGRRARDARQRPRPLRPAPAADPGDRRPLPARRSDEILGWIAESSTRARCSARSRTFVDHVRAAVRRRGPRRADRDGHRTSRGCPDDERAEVLARGPRQLGEAQPESPFPFRYRTRARRVCRAVTATTL